jgi:pimeloyl-ACP methyl ester carboxylesterase
LKARTPQALRIRWAIVGAVVALLGGALGQAASAGAAKVPTGPGGLRFYKPPKDLPRGHGKLVWSRKAGGLVPLAEASSTKLVLYTSQTPQGKDVAVSGSVSIPKGDPPKGGWPVITYAHGTTGTADACAPSRVANGGLAVGYVTYINPELNDWLEAGYAVVRTDYQGLGTPGKHSFLIGTAEGRSVLDIVRAARQLDPDIGKRYLIAGHSQGGHAALFAAGAAAAYTPDLKLRGTVAYAPASHLLEQAKLLPLLTQPSALSALAVLILQGASTANSKIDIQKILSDPALALYPQVNKVCEPQLGAANSYGGQAPSTLIRPGANTGPLFKVLGRNNPAVKTKAPILMPQGEADQTVFPDFTTKLDQELVAAGDDVTYKLYPGVDHGGVVSAAEPDVLGFFERRLPPG